MVAYETLTTPVGVAIILLCSRQRAVVSPHPCRVAPQRELRGRRLAREGGESERQIRLLAEREMAGQSLPDERSMTYNNQYNASAARQNRAR